MPANTHTWKHSQTLFLSDIFVLFWLVYILTRCYHETS